MPASTSLAACLINISEGRRHEVVWSVVRAACQAIERPLKGSEGSSSQIKAVVLNTFVDKEYNRSVVTVAGQLPALEEAVLAAAKEAYTRIDLGSHEGGHPRLGAVDLLPFHPLTPDLSVAECGVFARRVGTRLLQEAPRTSFFFYGGADEGGGRSLASRRKELGWFEGGTPGGSPDLGTFHPGVGLTGVGAAPYMANFNLSLNTRLPQVGTAVLRKIREKSGGLLGVAAMAFPHGGGTEVACNVDMFLFDETNPKHREESLEGRVERAMGEYWRTRPCAIEQAVDEVATAEGVQVMGSSLVVGFPLETARQLTWDALDRGEVCLVKASEVGSSNVM